MEKISTVVYGVVCLVVVVLLVSLTVVPVIENAQEEQYSTKNNTDSIRYTMLEASDSDTHTVYVDSDLVLYLDDVAVLTGGVYYYFMFIGDTFDITMTSGGTLEIHYGASGSSAVNAGAGSITFNQGTLSRTVSGTTTDVTTYSYALIPALASDSTYFVGSSGSAVKYVNADSKIYAYVPVSFFGLTSGTSCVEYSIKDNVTVIHVSTVVDGNVTNYDITTGYTAAFASVEAIDDICYSVSGSLVLTKTSDSTTQNASQVYYPIEYNYIDSADSSVISLLSIIPLVMFIVPIMFAVRMISAGRD